MSPFCVHSPLCLGCFIPQLCTNTPHTLKHTISYVHLSCAVRASPGAAVLVRFSYSRDVIPAAEASVAVHEERVFHELDFIQDTTFPFNPRDRKIRETKKGAVVLVSEVGLVVGERHCNQKTPPGFCQPAQSPDEDSSGSCERHMGCTPPIQFTSYALKSMRKSG